MRKYSDAPKDVAEAIKAGIPVTDKEALGDDWKKLPFGRTSQKKSRKDSSRLSKNVPSPGSTQKKASK